MATPQPQYKYDWFTGEYKLIEPKTDWWGPPPPSDLQSYSNSLAYKAPKPATQVIQPQVVQPQAIQPPVLVQPAQAIPKPPTKPPFTRFQAQEYMNTHYPQTQDQLQKHIEKTLHFYKTNSPRLPPCDEILWEWFQGSFRL